MFDQILDLVGQPPGSLVYHFIILFAIEAAFAIAIGQWLRERDTSTFRLAIAIFIVFGGRVIVLIASLAAWQGYLPRNVLLPPVERAVDTITIMAIGWAFVTMDDPEFLGRNFAADVIGGTALGFAAISFAGTYYFWSFGTSSETLFNGLWIDVVWAVAQIVISLASLIWMLARIRYVYDPVIKGIVLVLLAAAAAFHLISPVLGDVAAAMRVGQIIVIPMLAAITYRHVVEQLLHWDEFEPSRPSAGALPAAPTMQEATESKEAPAPPPETLQDTVKADQAEPPKPAEISASPQLLEVVEAVGSMLGTLEPEELVNEAPKAVAIALRADICVLAIVDEDVQQAAILGGYDNISQSALRRDVLELSSHPAIVNALGRLRQMRLTTQRNGRELRDLYARLGITHEGPAYIQPMVSGEERVGVLIAASPYSQRSLSNEERNLLDRLAPLVTAVLINAENYKSLQEQAEVTSAEEATRNVQLSDSLTAKISELNAAERQIEEMKSYIRDIHRQLEEVPHQQELAQTRIHELEDETERLRRKAEEVETLKAEIAELRQRPDPSAIEQTLLQKQLEEARFNAQTEIASLRARLAQASITQQEVSFLQEQLAIKAREVIQLQTRLIEAEAVGNALREQVGSSPGTMQQLEVLNTRVAEQATEIVSLQVQLAEARAASALSADDVRAQEAMDQMDRDAMAQLEAQLAERAALVDELSRQLSDKSRAIEALREHMAEVNASLRALEKQLDHKTEEVAALQQSLGQTRVEAQERIAALEAELAGDTGTAEIDAAHVKMLEAELAEKASVVEMLEEQLENTRLSMSSLEDQLATTQQAVGEAISGAHQVDVQDEVIASIAQELRTPMSSIMGYTELLLRESVGILGPLQRKFLQRVKANTERLGALLDDLIRFTTMDLDSISLVPETIDIFFALEEVITDVSSQFGEKGLTLHLTVPDRLPAITADREAFIDIVHHLLLNAALASPVHGDVELIAHATRTNLTSDGDGTEPVNCLAIHVIDSGAGIAPDDFERVFMRKYRADNPLIEGLGDTGVGLSLAKALVEAHGGCIWLDRDQETGTTFRVLLPVESPVLQAGEAG
nr:hypothetical protein [Anaerolineae bacterium]